MTHLRLTRRRPRPRVDYSEMLWVQLNMAQPALEKCREYKFHPVRLWRLDLAFEREKLAVEIEGFGPGGTAGRHQRMAGFTADCEKYAELAIAGWRLIRVTTAQVRSGQALTWIERALGLRRP